MSGITMTDSEGTALPQTSHSTWQLYLSDWGDGCGPELSLSIPEYFVCADNNSYDGDGVILARLIDVLEDYIVNPPDGLEYVHVFTAWLRNYADRLEQRHAHFQQADDTTPSLPAADPAP